MIFSESHLKDAVEVFVQKRKPKYDESFHISKLIELFSKGNGVAEFCADALIVRSTFHEWIKKYPNFKEAYEYAQVCSECVWNAPIFVGAMNFQMWLIQMKNRFNYSDERKLSIPKIKGAKTFDEHHKIIIEHVAEGTITAKEAQQLSSLILAGQKIAQDDKMELLTKQMMAVSEHLGLSHEALAA